MNREHGRKRERGVELPESLPQSHPDYAGRERYNVVQAAMYLQISTDLVRREMDGREITFRRIGRVASFTQADLDEYRVSHRVRAVGPTRAAAVRIPGEKRTGRVVSMRDVMPRERHFG